MQRGIAARSTLLFAASIVGFFAACSSSSTGATSDTPSSSSSGASSSASSSSGSGGATSSSSSSSGSGGATSSSSGSGGATSSSSSSSGSGGAGGAGGGGAATPVFCPVADPFAQNLPPNAVRIQDAVLMQDDHWTMDKVYLIGSSFAIEQHTLTIDAGTVICLYQQGAITVGGVNAGEIHVNGTANAHVVITTTPDPNDMTKPSGFHGGLMMNQWMKSTLAYLDIWYGGPGGGGGSFAFDLPGTAGGTDPKQKLLVDHLTVGEVQTRAIDIGTPEGIDPASFVHVTGYAPVDPNGPMLMEVMDAEIRALSTLSPKNIVVDTANVPQGSRFVAVQTNITPGNLERDADLTDFGLPFVYGGNLGIYDDSGTNKEPKWTLHEGVTLALEGNLTLGDGPGNVPGDIVIAGTAQKPVKLTSLATIVGLQPAAGDWGGFLFVDGLFDPNVSKIDHAILEYGGAAGYGPSTSRCGADFVGVVTVEGHLAYAGPTISNTTIASSATNGVVTQGDDMNGACTTDYTKASITFQNVAQKNLVTGACM